MTNALPRVVEGADSYETEFSLTDIASCPTACRGSSEPLPYKITATLTVGEGCSPLLRRHEVTVGDSPDRGNVREADKRVAVLA